MQMADGGRRLVSSHRPGLARNTLPHRTSQEFRSPVGWREKQSGLLLYCGLWTVEAPPEFGTTLPLPRCKSTLCRHLAVALHWFPQLQLPHRIASLVSPSHHSPLTTLLCTALLCCIPPFQPVSYVCSRNVLLSLILDPPEGIPSANRVTLTTSSRT